MTAHADVSIITPYRNAVQFLPQLVGTLKQQSYQDWECLLVDDNSTDSGPQLLRSLTAGDQRFRLLAVRSQPKGTASARLPAIPRNLGLAHARAPLVAFLDVDDLWHPRKLERQIAFHQAARLDLSVTAYARFRLLDQPVDALRCPPGQLTLKSLQNCNVVPMLTVLIRRELLGQGFTATHHEDYLQWLNLKRDFPELRYGCLNEVLACYRLHRNNLSRRRHLLLAWTFRVFRLHGMTPFSSLLQLLRWSGAHGTTLWREWLERQMEAPTGASLLEAHVPRMVRAWRC